jgi:hypothetical protein
MYYLIVLMSDKKGGCFHAVDSTESAILKHHFLPSNMNRL